MENQIESLAELKNLAETEKGLLIYFYSDRCAPCLSLRPKVAQMVADDFEGLKLVFINSEQKPEIPAHFGVFANPSIIVFFEGKEFRRYSKYISISELGGDIDRVYKMVFE
ncbi:MAG: thioredoxin family protein [Bacteroidales bacterium]|nr:thioredoxin family protein [Bacteroidales bacterium]